MNKINQIKEKTDQFFMNTYAPYDISFEDGEGSKLIDSEGKEYIDFLAGIAVNCLGYKNKTILKAIRHYMKKPMCTSGYFLNYERALLAEQLVKGTHFNKVFFGNSGAEANECALKLVKKYAKVHGTPEKYKIITAYNSFHGRTLATVAATGQTKYNEVFTPLPAGLGIYIPYNDIDALKVALADPEVCALMIEPLQGEGGIVPATAEYMKAARAITKRNKQLLILDEIQTGAGRTGTFYCYKQYGIKPDIVTLAKAIGGGIPISACVATDEAADAFNVGDHGTTFGGNPFCTGIAYEVVKKLKSKAMRDHINETGAYFKKRLIDDFSCYSYIKEVRGLGLMLGLDIDDTVSAKKIVGTMLERGYILNSCGKNVLRFVPPLVITTEEIDAMLNELKKLFDSLK